MYARQLQLIYLACLWVCLVSMLGTAAFVLAAVWGVLDNKWTLGWSLGWTCGTLLTVAIVTMWTLRWFRDMTSRFVPVPRIGSGSLRHSTSAEAL